MSEGISPKQAITPMADFGAPKVLDFLELPRKGQTVAGQASVPPPLAASSPFRPKKKRVGLTGH